MRARLVLIGLAAAALVAPATLQLASVSAAAPGPLGLTCDTVTAGNAQYKKCTGEIPSFDGVGLDTDVSLPASWQPGDAPLPTIVMMHGWSGDKTDWEADSPEGTGGDDYHWNNVWFATNGWAVVNYTARGFEESCGITDSDANCPTTGTHLADRRWETKDTQTILGKLVDAKVADAARLAATGGSYGGGQSWLLATSMPWTSPDGTTLQLAGAVPKYPWTDLLYSLAPNGRETDDPYTPGHDDTHTTPFGILKASYVSGLYAVGRANAAGRYDPPDGLPDDPASQIDTQFARSTAGEPYDGDPVVAAFVKDFRNKSPYYADDYMKAVAAGTVKPVPVFSIQGWTDPLFPPVETLQMYRKLKYYDPDYPVFMAFGDVGHSNAQNPQWQWQDINGQGNQFLQTYVLGQGNGTPPAQVFGFLTDCGSGTVQHSRLSGTGWDDFANGTATASAPPTSTRQTTSADTSPATGLATDPITHSGCLHSDAATSQESTWSWQVPAGTGLTLLGLPKLKIDYAMAGADATPAFYLWDVAPDGSRTLVTRGEWRLSAAAGDPATGTIVTKLYGNGYVFQAGHQVQLEVTQTDTPYLRPDNTPSSITWSGPTLTMPTLAASSPTLVPTTP